MKRKHLTEGGGGIPAGQRGASRGGNRSRDLILPPFTDGVLPSCASNHQRDSQPDFQKGSNYRACRLQPVFMLLLKGNYLTTRTTTSPASETEKEIGEGKITV